MKLLPYLLFLLLPSIGHSFNVGDAKTIKNASEAAPEHITSAATILKFTGTEFIPIQKGTNNFTCFTVTEPKGRFEPACLNKEAMRSVFPTYALHMKLMYKGFSYTETSKKLGAAYKKGEIPTAETAALVYMMSPNNIVYDPKTDAVRPFPTHQMYFYPKLENETFSLKKGPPWLWQGFPHMSALIVYVKS